MKSEGNTQGALAESATATAKPPATPNTFGAKVVFDFLNHSPAVASTIQLSINPPIQSSGCLPAVKNQKAGNNSKPQLFLTIPWILKDHNGRIDSASRNRMNNRSVWKKSVAGPARELSRFSRLMGRQISAGL